MMEAAIGLLLLLLTLGGKHKSKGTGNGVYEKHGRVNGYPYLVEHMGGGYVVQLITSPPVVGGEPIVTNTQIPFQHSEQETFRIAVATAESYLGDLPPHEGAPLPWPNHWPAEG